MTDRPKEGQIPSTASLDFPTIFKSEFAWVWRTVRRLGAREADTEDLVHEVFVVFFRTQSDYDPARALRPWLFGIAFRVVSSHRRRASVRREVLDDPAEPPDSKPGAEQQLGKAEDNSLVLQALQMIPEERRVVFVLHELDEVAMPEVARTLQIPLNTGYSRLRIARQEFRDAVLALRGKESR